MGSVKNRFYGDIKHSNSDTIWTARSRQSIIVTYIQLIYTYTWRINLKLVQTHQKLVYRANCCFSTIRSSPTQPFYWCTSSYSLLTTPLGMCHQILPCARWIQYVNLQHIPWFFLRIILLVFSNKVLGFLSGISPSDILLKFYQLVFTSSC
jgi:hypothetical protein